MKKFFGTLLQIFGLIIITISCVVATEISCEKKSLLSQAQTELDYGYRSSLESS